MPHCYWCYHILNDFNKIIDDFSKPHLRDKVAFLKIDGPAVRQFSQRYKITSYPKFIALQPDTDGNRFSVFGGAKRSYDTLKDWINGLLPKDS